MYYTNTKQLGFTLIELLMVLAIIGILAATVIPMYQNYVVRGKNSAALSDLRNFKATLEAFYSDKQSYPQW